MPKAKQTKENTQDEENFASNYPPFIICFHFITKMQVIILLSNNNKTNYSQSNSQLLISLVYVAWGSLISSKSSSENK